MREGPRLVNLYGKAIIGLRVEKGLVRFGVRSRISSKNGEEPKSEETAQHIFSSRRRGRIISGTLLEYVRGLPWSLTACVRVGSPKPCGRSAQRANLPRRRLKRPFVGAHRCPIHAIG